MCFGLLLFCSSGAAPAQETIPLIDLVANPRIAARQPREYGFTGGGTLSGHPPIQPKLPLDIELESISESGTADYIFIAEVVLRNIGAEPFPLPVGRDGDLALKPGNGDRHEFWFRLQATGDSSGSSVEVMYASADVPGSFMALPAEAAVRVRFSANLSAKLRDWKKEGRSAVELGVECSDMRYEDEHPLGDYVTVGQWPKAFSENRLTLSLE